MSDKLGRLRYSENEEQVFLGRSLAQTKSISEATARLIDDEVRRIIEEAEDRAQQALKESMNALHAVAEALLLYETLSGDEVRRILAGETLVRSDHSDEGPASGRTAIPSAGTAASTGRRPVFGPPQVQPQG